MGASTSIHLQNTTPFPVNLSGIFTGIGNGGPKYHLKPDSSLAIPLDEVQHYGKFILELRSDQGAILKSVIFPIKHYSRWSINFDGIGECVWTKGNWSVNYYVPFYQWNKDYDHTFIIDRMKMYQPISYDIHPKSATAPIPTISLSDLSEKIEKHLKDVVDDDEKWATELISEMEAAFLQNHQKFADAFSSDKNCYKVLHVLGSFASEQYGTTESDFVCCMIFNEIMLIYDAMKGQTFKNFKADDAKVKEGQEKVLTQFKELVSKPTFLENAADYYSTQPEVNQALVQVLFDNCDFPKTESSIGLHLYFIQENDKRKPLYNREKDSKLFLELCGKLLKIDVSAKEVSQRERELILCLLTAIVVKDVKTSDLNNYIEKMVKIQAREGKAADGSNEEDRNYHQEKGSLALLVIAALEQSIYNSKDLHIPIDCIGYMSEYPEQFLAGEMLTYSLEVLGTSTEKDTVYCAKICTAFAAAKNKTMIFENEKTMLTFSTLFEKKVHPADTLYSHLIMAVQNATASLKLTKNHVPKLVDCLTTVLREEKAETLSYTVNTLQLIKACCTSDKNFVEVAGMKDFSKGVIAQLKTYLESKQKDGIDKEVWTEFFSGFSAVIALKGEKVHVDTIKIILEMEKGVKPEVKDGRKFALETVEKALGHMDGDDKDAQNWEIYLGDPKYDGNGDLQAAILRSIAFPSERIETLVKSELTKFEIRGQQAILRALIKFNPFPQPVVTNIIELMTPKSATDPENALIIPECLSIIKSWLGHKETKGDVSKELTSLFDTIQKNDWIFVESFDRIFAIAETILAKENEKDNQINPTDGEITHFSSYIKQALESESDENPATYATKLLLKLTTSIAESDQEHINDLIKRRSQISGDPKVQENIVRLVTLEKSWVKLTLPEISKLLRNTPYDIKIAGILVQQFAEKDDEDVALDLVEYVAKAPKLEEDVQKLIAQIVSTSTNTMVLMDVISFLENTISSQFPDIKQEWISQLFEILNKKQAIKDGRAELLDVFLPLVFSLELYYGLDPKLWTDWTDLLNKLGLSLSSKRYMEWITTANKERLDGKVKVSLDDYSTSTSWVAQWGKADREGLLHIAYHLPSIKTIPLGTKLKLYCMAADMTNLTFTKDDKTAVSSTEETPEEFYFRAFTQLDDTESKENWKLTNEQLKTLKQKLKDDSLTVFTELVILLGKYYVTNAKYDVATALFDSNLDPTEGKKLKDQINVLTEVEKDLAKLPKEDEDLHKKIMEIDPKNGEALMKKLIKELGLDYFNEGKSSLANLLKSIPSKNVDAKILSSTLTWDWGKELLHSYIVTNLLENKNNTQVTKENIKIEFAQLWNEFVTKHVPIRYNPTNIKTDVEFLAKIKEKVDKIFGSEFRIEKVNLLFILLQNLETYNFFENEKEIPSLETLQATWIKKLIGKEDLDEKLVQEFWKKTAELNYLTGEVLGFKAIQKLVSSISSSEFQNVSGLLDLLKQLEFSSQNFLMVVPNFENPTEKQTVADITQRVQDFYLQIVIGNFAANFFHFKKSTGIDQICVKLAHLLNSAERKGWDFATIKRFFDLVKSKFEASDKADDQQDQIAYAFSGVLNHFGSYDFEMDAVKKTLEKVEGKDEVIKNWISHLPPLPHADNAKERELDELVKLVTTDNGDKVNADEIKKLISSLDSLEMKSWDKEKITEWAKNQKTNDKPSISDTMCVICRTAELILSNKPRTAQMVALAALIQSVEKGKDIGRLAKIETGEGKSLIIAMLASYVCLNKKDMKVDVITTSSTLATRDVDDNKALFETLGLSVVLLTQRGTEETYKNDVVYGDTTSFQADALREIFHFEKVRGDRKFKFCIVDEVDSMLIDQASYATKLVDKVPGFEFMEIVYTAIWKHVNDIENLFLPLGANQEVYCVDQTVGMDPKDIISLLSKVNSKDGKGSRKILLSRIQGFCENNLNREKGDQKTREDLKTLIENKKLPGLPAGKSEISNEELDEIIKLRWDYEKGGAVLRRICEKLLGHKIIVMTVTDDGFSPYSGYHDTPGNDGNDIPDYFRPIYLFYFSQQLMRLIPVEASSSQMRQKVAARIKDLIVASTEKSVESEKKLVIPNHFMDFFKGKLMTWIQSAITARYHMDKDQAYIVKKGEKDGERKSIIPVDVEHTGALEQDSVWPDGLHQFLQLKHKLAFTPERISTNFMSNLTFFNKYEGNVLGVTGTLGSITESGMLEKVYSVDTIHLPTFQEKRHIMLQDLAFQTESDYMSAILTSVYTTTKQGRAILVICKTIEDVTSLETYLNEAISEVGEPPNIQKYSRPDVDKEKHVPLSDLVPGSIVLATNLAGRGTDLKINKDVDTNGGLHVCVTFLPRNLRVEEQARGRASRNGKRGSSQLIIWNQDSTRQDWKAWQAVTELKKVTAQVEEEEISNVTNITIPNIKVQDKLFSDYCEKRLKLYNDKKDDVNRDRLLEALDERWGFLLDNNNLKINASPSKKIIDPKTIPLDSLDNGSDVDAIKNAQYHMLMANNYMEKENYGDAISRYDQSVKLDKSFSGTAFYYRAYSRINEFKDDYKKKAIADLDDAFNLMQNLYHPALMSCNSYTMNVADVDADEDKRKDENSDDTEKPKDKDYTIQITGKLHLLKLWAETIGAAKEQLGTSSEVKAKLVSIEDHVKGYEDKDKIASSEIQDMKDAGIAYFLEIEKRPAPWWAIFTVIVVGVVEAVVGLAIMAFSGGALGEAFLIDGVLDIANGIEAAITGEYISLSEFFKQKAINAGIMLATFGFGAIMSKVATVLKGTKFIQFLSRGKDLFASAGKFISNSWVGRVGQALKKTVVKIQSFVFTKTKLFWKAMKTAGQFVWNATKAAGRRIKGAWESITKYWKEAEEAIEEGEETLTRSVSEAESEVAETESATSTSLTGENLRGTQFKNLGKIVGKEMGRRALLKGLDFALQKGLEPVITKWIKEAIHKKVQEKVNERMKSDSVLKPLTKFVQEAETVTNYTAKKNEFNAMWTQIVDDTLQIDNAGIQAFLQVVDEFCDEAQRTLVEKREQEGARATLAWVIEKFGIVVFEITSFSVMIEELVTTMGTLFDKFVSELKSKTGDGQPDEIPKESYIYAKEGKDAFDKDKTELSQKIANEITSQLVAIIVQGLFRPHAEKVLNSMTKKMKLFKTEHLIEELGKMQEANGHPERFPNANIWDMYKKNTHVKDEIHEETSAYAARKAEEARLLAPVADNLSAEIVVSRTDSIGSDSPNETTPLVLESSVGEGPQIHIAYNSRLDEYYPVIRQLDGTYRAVPFDAQGATQRDWQGDTHGNGLIPSIVVGDKGRFEGKLNNINMLLKRLHLNGSQA